MPQCPYSYCISALECFSLSYFLPWNLHSASKTKQNRAKHTHTHTHTHIFVSFPASNLFIFNWRKTASQYCIDLCLDQWVSRKYTCVPSVFNLPPASSTFPPLLVVIEPQFEFSVSYNKFPLVICFTHGSVYASMLLSPFTPLSLSSPPPMSISLFSMPVPPLLTCN